MGRIQITTEKPKLTEAIQQFLDERELKGLDYDKLNPLDNLTTKGSKITL